MSITKIYLILLIQIIGCFHVIGQDLKPQLIIPSGNTGRVDQISFSQDSKYVASSFGSDQIVVWDILLGKITHTFRASGRVTALHFHPKLPWIIASSVTGTIHFWKYSGNAASEEIQAHQGAVNTMAISHNGKLLISNGNDALIKVWDIEKREITTTLNKYSEVFSSAVFDFQDDLITLGSTSGSVLTLNAVNFEEEFYQPVTEGSINSLDYSLDGKYLIFGDSKGFANIWETNPMKQNQKLKVFQNAVYEIKWNNHFILATGRDPESNFKIINHSSDSTQHLNINFEEDKSNPDFIFGINSMALSNNNLLALPDHNGLLRIFDLNTQKTITRLRGYSYPVNSIDLTGYEMAYNTINSIQFLDLSGRNQLKTIKWKSEIQSFQRKGNRLLLLDYSNKISLLDLEGNVLQSFPVSSQALLAPVNFGPSENIVIYRANEDYLVARDITTGKEKKIKSKNCYLYKVQKDNIITLSNRNTIEVFDSEKFKRKKSITLDNLLAFDLDQRGENLYGIFPAGSKQEVRKVNLETGSVSMKMEIPDSIMANRIYFSGENSVFTVSRSTGKFNQKEDYAIYFWDLEKKKLLHNLVGHQWYINDLKVANSGTLFSASMDGTLRAWGTDDTSEIFSLIPLNGKDWAVVNRDGLFDGSQGALNKMYYNLNNQIVSLQQMKESFYEPKLIQKLLGYSKEAFYNQIENQEFTMYPEIQIQAPKDEMLNFKLEDNGGGIGKVSIKLNGKEVVEDITKTEIYNLETNTFEFLLSHPFIRPESLNKLSVEAFNDKGYPLSNQKNIYFIPEKRENTAPVPSKLFVLSIGISDYRGKAIDLNYAAKDATDFADAMEIAGVAQFGEDNFELFRMTTDTNQKGTYPLKENISSTFKEIANQANPEDIFMVYFAGHGLDLENDDEFYFLTAEAEHPYVRGPEEARGISLSSSELAELFKLVPSQKQVLVVDACHSGNLANGLFSENGQLKTEGIRALDKVKDRTGLYILASSEGAEVSYESSHLEQGLLTYSLLFGLKGEALQDNEYVDVIDMLQYARKKVPELADEIGERQIPIVQIPQDASSFYLGRLGTAEKGKIKINSAKPIVLSSSFQNEETLLDEQHAGLKMDEIIKNDRSKYNNQYLFIEQGGVFSNAYSIYGRYRKEGNGYVVDYRIFNGEKELKKGSLSDQNLEDLLNVIADELIKLIIDN